MNQGGVLQDDSKKAIMEVSESFGIMLKYFRELRGYTLKDLESISNVSSAYIHRLENGQRKSPGLPVVHSLAEALNVSWLKLLESAFKEALSSQDQDETISLQELLIKNDYLVNQKPITKEAKEILMKIFVTIAECEWNEKTKWQVMSEVGNLTEQYKELT